MVLLFKLLKRAFGLVDLCSTAFSNRASSPGARDICSAAFRNVLTFFVLSFEEKDIFQIVDISDLKVQVPDDFFPRLMQKLSDGDSLPLIKLSQFLKLFLNFPKNLIPSCLFVVNGECSNGEVSHYSYDRKD